MSDEDREIAVELTMEQLAEQLGLPPDASITHVRMIERGVRIVMHTRHGYIVPARGEVPCAPLAQLQIKRLEEGL